MKKNFNHRKSHLS